MPRMCPDTPALRLPVALAPALVLAVSLLSPAADTVPARDLTELSLEELMDVTVTSVSKKVQALSRVPAAVHVITHREIRRSQATTIPELLRRVPGLHVAQLSQHQWTITSRGFNGRWANKLLVLIDGRTVYSPLFSGVYWSAQDALLADIERIEVIRGPGASVWGANAVNGVINIITRDAAATQGGLVELGGGTREQGEAALRYGGSLGGDLHYRLYGKGFTRGDYPNTAGDDAHDEWDALRGGLRVDWQAGPEDRLMLQGEIHDAKAAQTTVLASLTPPASRATEDCIDYSTGHLLLRWEHTMSATSSWSLAGYFDTARRKDVSLGQRIDTYDVEAQHRFAPLERHDVTWGIGYRRIEDWIENTFTVAFDPDRQGTDLFGAFLQDDIALTDDLVLTLGLKVEHNDYTDVEVQPSARMVWSLAPEHSVWASVSRAVRTPSRSHADIRVNTAAIPGSPLPGLVAVLGNDDLRSEELIAWEAGYRGQITRDVSLDLALFLNDYDDLTITDALPPQVEVSPAPPHLLFPQLMADSMHGHAYGLEACVVWQARPWWRLSTAYSLLHVSLTRETATSDAAKQEKWEDGSPEHQLQLHSAMDLPANTQLDLSLAWVDRLPAHGIPAYLRGDARLAWSPRPELELAVGVTNVFDDRHPEASAVDLVASEVPRSVYGRLRWSF